MTDADLIAENNLEDLLSFARAIRSRLPAA